MSNLGGFKLKDDLTVRQVQQINAKLRLAGAFAFLWLVLTVIGIIVLLNGHGLEGLILGVLGYVSAYNCDVLFKEAKRMALDD